MSIDERDHGPSRGCRAPWAARAVAVLAAAALPTLAAAQGSGNVCEDQIRKIVASKFGQTVSRVEFRYQTNLQTGSGQMMLSQALAYPAECPGWHFFDVLGDDFTCERQAGAGQAATLVNYRSSGDGC